MQNPADMQIAHVVNNVAGASPAFATQGVIGAPGAGKRLRIWSFGIAAITGVGVGVLFQGYWRPIGDPWRIAQSGAREAAYPPVMIPGGIALPDNTGWELTSSSTGATRTYPCWTAYTIEAV